MSYLLFPGRHLANTRFQEDYLTNCLTCELDSIPGLMKGQALPAGRTSDILFAITSSNQENSRYNPIPFPIRAVGVDRFARSLRSKAPFRYRLFGIPHYGHTRNFAAFTLKEIEEQSEGVVRLTPANTIILCSTPEVIALYQNLGFSVATAEQTAPEATHPIDLIKEIGRLGDAWRSGAILASNLAAATVELFDDFPETPRRIARLYQDPLTNQEGSLTGTRNYSTYARGMNEIIRLKYLDIRDSIRPGRIADEGCADGALLAEISHDFPDSDLLGIDLSAEFSQRFKERQRAGEFGGAYVHFFHRNLFDRIFEANSLDTTLCNSTLHEIWSYGSGEASVRGYLAEKYRQLRPGGVLIIRDVVGPEHSDRIVHLECSESDGENPQESSLATNGSREPEWLSRLSTRARFLLFARDFLAGRKPFPFEEIKSGGQWKVKIALRLASEFLSKKDYIDNWKSELNEEFCFWSFTDWKKALTASEFKVLENPNAANGSSRVYVNPWTVENRYTGKVALFDPETGHQMNYPPTNMVLAAQKPLTD